MSSKLDANMDDWEQFLESNYHQLSRGIRVENLLGRLRTVRVLTVDDQEMILNKYCTPFLKAGHLVDIVKMKGKPGFDKFMEAIEFEYPELFKEITGREPHPNPDKDRGERRRPAGSIVVLDQMGDLIHTFSHQLTQKHMELKQFENLVRELTATTQELRTDIERQSEEQRILEDKIRQLEDTIQELRDDKKEVTENLTKERRLREELVEKYDRLRSKNLDEMFNLSRQPIRQCYSLNTVLTAPTSNSPSSPPAGSSSSTNSSTTTTTTTSSSSSKPPSPIAGKVQMLKKAYEKGNPKPCLPEAEAEAKIDKKTGSEIESRPSADVTGLEESCCRLQESNDRLQCCIEEFQKEVNECRSKQLEAESLSREANAENEKLKSEMRKMEDQCKVMADMIKRLKNEIDCRPPKPRTLIIPQMFPKSGSDEDDSQPSSATSTTSVSPKGAAGRLRLTPRPKPDDLKRAGSEPAPITNKLLQSSFDLLVDPWKSVDKN